MTSPLWTPENTPPQLNADACQVVLERVEDKGLVEVYVDAAELLSDSEMALAEHLGQMGRTTRPIIAGDVLPRNGVRIGATLAWLGYRESGYLQTINDSFEVGQMFAELEGIPDAYIASYSGDASLRSLIKSASESSSFNSYIAPVNEQSKWLGAGCVRFYLHNALIAA